MEQRYITACYCRLSQDDENDGTSVSIETQKKVLSDYCKAHDFEIYDFYCDDGYTGTNFDRPAFKRMMEDAEKGKINLIIVKDLSRFGREYIMVGYYTQRYYPEHNIRFIAIADDTDINHGTLYKYDMMMPIKNIFNEFFPAETSMKVRQACITKAKHGEYIGSKAPYGYKKSPDDKHVLIVDEETAPIVRRIFEMAAYEGMGFQKISFKLYEDEIMTPSALNDMRTGKEHKGNPYQWNLGTVKSIIENQVYKGTLVSGKRRKLSFKSDKIVKADESDWIINENMCEPIVSEQLWNDAHMRIKARKFDRTDKLENVFVGLLKCEECGYSMRISNSKERRTYFACGNYKKPKRGEERCSSHFIYYDVVYRAVLMDINRVIKAYANDEEGFRHKLQSIFKANDSSRREGIHNAISLTESEIEKQKRRYKQLYDDRLNGLIDDEMFREMAEESSTARKNLADKLEYLNAMAQEQSEHSRGIEQFIELISQQENETIEKLDKEILNRLIEKVTISEEYVADKKRMKVKIYYKYLGNCTL